MTGGLKSTLERKTLTTLLGWSCVPGRSVLPLKLAPTASTTATLAMGDAPAVMVLDGTGFIFEKRFRAFAPGRKSRSPACYCMWKISTRTGDVLPVYTRQA